MIAVNSNPVQSYALFGVAALLVSVTIKFVCRATLHRDRLPPGPKKVPILGNLLDIPTEKEWETYSKWSKELNSDIIHLDVAGTSIIILSSVEAAVDLLEKRSAIYSDRPRAPMLELVGGDFMFGFMKYGETWRTHRRLFAKVFPPGSSPRFHEQEIRRAHDLLRRLLDDPDGFAHHVGHIVGANIISIAYGLNVKPTSDDPYLNAMNTGIDAVTMATMRGRFLVDNLPILKYVPAWFPGAGFKHKAAEWKKRVERMTDFTFAAAKRLVEGGSSRPSFVADNLRALDGHPDTDWTAQEYTIKSVAGTMFAGGSDTTRTTLIAFFLAMLQNPEAQKKAQQEIDSVVSTGHLPTFMDEKSLPYTTAMVKEVVRWWPVIPLGIPHYLEVEDVYGGYRIPAGSIVIANAWAMLRDETVYPDPEAFRPERFLVDGKLGSNGRDPDAAFGFGRRACPGQYMALNTVWIMAVSVLAAFDISAVKVDGDDTVEHPGHNFGLAFAPPPFRCSIQPRSKEAANLIRSTSNPF